MTINLFLIGPSGSGKSTQAKLIADKYGLTHLSMGQLLRNEISTASPSGLMAKQYIDQGIPTPDSVVIPLLKSNLAKLDNQNFIIDGFPRLIDQAKEIDLYLQDMGYPISSLIHLQCDFREILRRRQTNPDFQREDTNRSDNTPQAIANRQKILYEANINPIIAYFKQRNQLIEVDGNRPIGPIFTDICQKIDMLIVQLQGK